MINLNSIRAIIRVHEASTFHSRAGDKSDIIKNISYDTHVDVCRKLQISRWHEAYSMVSEKVRSDFF